MADVKGKVALVTGGGSGIGWGLAHELSKQGAKVVVADIIKENAEKVAAEINQAGGTAVAVHADVCDRDAVKKMKADANKVFGRVSWLFANAGATNFDKLTDMTDADIDWIFTVNLTGVINCLTTFLPDMIAAKEGHVCATASVAGLFPAWIPVHSAYGSAKMGAIGMMLNVRMELAEHNVGASVYCPGGVATGMKENNARYRPAKFGGPGKGEVHISADSHTSIPKSFLSPQTVAKLVVQACRENQPIILDHSDQRQVFIDTYVNTVMKAFDYAAAFEKAEGIQVG
jgi:NAD(P)-dependent dehydrogenase (short-subunit alcohol dehydrogenase family)